jgi:hypothetical protein
LPGQLFPPVAAHARQTERRKARLRLTKMPAGYRPQLVRAGLHDRLFPLPKTFARQDYLSNQISATPWSLISALAHDKAPYNPCLCLFAKKFLRTTFSSHCI